MATFRLVPTVLNTNRSYLLRTSSASPIVFTSQTRSRVSFSQRQHIVPNSLRISAAHFSSSRRCYATKTESTNKMSSPFLDAFKARRSIYQLTKDVPISDEKILQIVKDVVLHSPSSFNSQSSRYVVLLKEEHDAFWEIVKDVLKPIVKENWEATESKLNGFKAAYGTVLLYEEITTVHEFQTKYASYADKFPQWAEHTNAISQIALWTAFDAEGLGCNLQHYNPLVDQPVEAKWKIPETWSLKAQLVFGGRSPDYKEQEKSFKPVEGERLLVFGN